MEHSEESVLDLVREGDLDVRLSCAFLLNCKQGSFIKIRDMIEELFEDSRGERIILGTGSSTKLYIVKEGQVVRNGQVVNEEEYYGKR